MLDTPMDVQQESRIPRLDHNKNSYFCTMVIVPIFLEFGLAARPYKTST
jgi:hypothetical protein